MQLRVFRGASIAEALTQVKSQVGPDAVILHTRTIVQRYCLGIRRREIYEITAARGLRTRRSMEATKPQAIAASRGIARPRAAAGGTALLDPPPGRELAESPAVSGVLYRELTEQIATVTKMVAELQAPNVPEGMQEFYSLLTSNQVCPKLAAEVVKNLNRAVRPEHLQHADFVKEKLAEQVEKMMAVAGPITRARVKGPHVIALIGPTGVGKTTTIAKLAANLKLKEKHRVGLITIDTYRIAAIDQLKKYADIIGSNLRVVGSPDELDGAIASMSECEFVLIDTAGRSPNDTLKLGELRSFISLAKADEVHLVLSATSSEECVALAIERFGDVRIDKIIFTKLDETRKLGTMLNVVRSVNKPLSYVTTGQDVPDDIEVAQGRRLAQLILGSEL